jgi:hypothetical protein
MTAVYLIATAIATGKCPCVVDRTTALRPIVILQVSLSTGVGKEEFCQKNALQYCMVGDTGLESVTFTV